MLQKDAVCLLFSTLSIIIEQSCLFSDKKTQNYDNLWSCDW